MAENNSNNEASRVFLWLGIGVLVVLLLGLPFGRWWGWTDGWGWVGTWIGLIFLMPVLFLVLIVVLIVAIATGSSRQSHGPPPPQAAYEAPAPEPEDDALSILDRRYAAGELSRAEYLRMRKDLS